MAGPTPPQKLCPSCGTSVPQDANICHQCGYNFNTGPYSKPPSTAPPIGFAPNYQAGYARPGYDQQDTGAADGLAIASLVFGIISLILFCIWILAVPCALLGFVFGLFGLKGRNRNIAVAGLVCSVAGVIISVGLIVLLFASGFGKS